MVQLAALVLGFPAGYFIASKRNATIALFAVLSIALIPQTVMVNNDGNVDAAYWIVQAITFAVGYGLVTWGSHIATNRRASAGIEA